MKGNMGDDIEITVRTFPMLDTGIGQEAGYESDKAFIEAMDKKRAAMPPAVRAAMDKIDAELERKFLFGEGD